MSGSDHDKENAIRQRAYFIWEREGRPEGRAYDHWVSAVVEEFGEERDMAPTQESEDETSQQRNERDYRLSKLPVFRESSEASIRQQTSEKLYGEICAGWRMLTDVRFKLLGLLPLASLAGGYGLFALHDQRAIEVILLKVLISVFGLVVTIGLVIYEQRNDGLYNDMISRGRRIEYEWGVDTGLFLGRKVSGFANHSRGTWTVYSATLALWLGALVISLIPLVGTVRSWLAL